MIKKSYRKRVIKPGQLVAYYGRDDDGNIDIVMGWGDGPGGKRDSHLLHYVLTRSVDGVTGPGFLAQLESRGYDLKTLKFSVSKKFVEPK